MTEGGIRIEVPDAAAAQDEWSEAFQLPRCKKMARLREPTVHDMIHAQKVVGKGAAEGESDIAIIAAMAELDGKRVIYEQLKGLKIRDLEALLAEARRLGFLASPSPTDADLLP